LSLAYQQCAVARTSIGGELSTRFGVRHQIPWGYRGSVLESSAIETDSYEMGWHRTAFSKDILNETA
jgi:hypothetical protein